MAVVFDSYNSSNYSTYAFASPGIVGQSFTVLTAATLTAASFYLFSQSSPTGNIYAYIYTHSGTYGTSSVGTGSPLATSDAVNITVIPSGYGSIGTVNFNFSGVNSISLTPGYYVVAVSFPTGASSTLGVGYDSTSPTHSGNLCLYSGGTWNAYSGYDGIFEVDGSVMANTVATSPGTVVDDASVGTVAWTNTSNSLSTYAYNANSPSTNPTFTSVKLVISGSVSGTDLATGSGGRAGVGIVSTFGGSSSLWGLALTPATINSSGFGVAYSLSGTSQSHYIKFTNFGFSIPSGAIINGVVAKVSTDSNSSYTFLGASVGGANQLSLQIYYSLVSTLTGISTIQGLSSITL